MQSMSENNRGVVGSIDFFFMWLWPRKFTQNNMELTWANNATNHTSLSIAAHN